MCVTIKYEYTIRLAIQGKVPVKCSKTCTPFNVDHSDFQDSSQGTSTQKAGRRAAQHPPQSLGWCSARTVQASTAPVMRHKWDITIRGVAWHSAHPGRVDRHPTPTPGHTGRSRSRVEHSYILYIIL